MFNGIYLVRESQSVANSFALSYVVGGQIRHCKIVRETSSSGKVCFEEMH